MLLIVLAALWGGCCALLAWVYPLRLRRLGDDCGAELEACLAVETDDRERLIAANDLLDEMEHRLGLDERLPLVAVWIVLLGELALAVIAIILRTPWLAWVICGFVGLVTALLCATAARVGRRLAGRERVRIDAMVADRLGGLYDAEIVLPRRRQRGGRRRRKRR